MIRKLQKIKRLKETHTETSSVKMKNGEDI